MTKKGKYVNIGFIKLTSMTHTGLWDKLSIYIQTTFFRFIFDIYPFRLTNKISKKQTNEINAEDILAYANKYSMLSCNNKREYMFSFIKRRKVQL